MNLAEQTLQYPKTKKNPTFDTYYGVRVEDPYQWLEDAESAETMQWIASQNELTDSFFGAIPSSRKIQERLRALWDHKKYRELFRAGEFIYYYQNDGLQNQFVLYRQQNGASPEVFFDPNTFFKDDAISVSNISFSRDGSLAAIEITRNGSDLHTVKVIRSSDKSLVDDTLDSVIFSRLAWLGNKGFFYSSYNSPGELALVDYHHKVYFHRMGTLQSEDILIFDGMKNPKRFIQADVTEDEKFLIVMATNALSGNELYAKRLDDDESEFIALAAEDDYHHLVICSEDSRFFVFTNCEAPNGKVVTIDAAEACTSWQRELIPETGRVLQASAGGGKIFAHYLDDGTSLIYQFNLDGVFEHEVQLPSMGSVFGFRGSKNDKEIIYTFTSYIHPPEIYSYHVVTQETRILVRDEIDFPSDQYVSKKVFYTSTDGTKIPMIITSRRDVKLDGRNPLLLYGYGGFGFNVMPEFNVSEIILFEQGGILAVPNLRGGGEYGRTWHEEGARLKKKNVIADFISAADFLTQNNYTSPEYLAIAGRSNGGTIVAASLARRPGLCKVALPSVGVMDMLKFHKFGSSATWAYEYGTADESKEFFEYLFSYSPLHQLKPELYPATLISTGMHDDRVVPAHSYKFAARLQEYQIGNAPILISIEANAGHGHGKSTAQKILEESRKWIFMFHNINMIAEQYPATKE